MLRIVIPIFLLLTFLCSPAIAEIITVTQTIKQTFGGSQSADDARIFAVAKAKREALEKAGVYVETLTVVKEARVDKDEILALTAGVVKAEVVSQKNYHTEDAFGIEVIVNVVVDTSVLEARVKKLLQDRTHITQLQETQKREKELLRKVAQLEEENRKLTAKKQSTEELKKQFQQTSQELTAVEWLYKTDALWDGNKYTDPEKTIEYVNNAIKLQPDYAEAYNNRGIAYDNLGQHQRAIENYNEAIRLQPDDASAYYNRGNTCYKLGQYQRSIEDFNTAIRLQPDLAIAYVGRGGAYGNLGQYQRSIEDINKAVRLQPDLSIAYAGRGTIYGMLGQYQRSIEDFNEVIRLQPDLSIAYAGRGLGYLNQGKNELCCLDAQKACELGDCRLFDRAKGEGRCP